MSTTFSEATNTYIGDLISGRVSVQQTTDYFAIPANRADFDIFLKLSPLRMTLATTSTVVQHLLSVQGSRRVLMNSQVFLKNIAKSSASVEAFLDTPADFWMGLETMLGFQGKPMYGAPETYAQMLAIPHVKALANGSNVFAQLFAASPELINRYIQDGFGNYAQLGRQYIINQGGIVPKGFGPSNLDMFIASSYNNGFLAELLMDSETLSRRVFEPTTAIDLERFFIQYMTHKGVDVTGLVLGTSPVTSYSKETIWSNSTSLRRYLGTPIFFDRITKKALQEYGDKTTDQKEFFLNTMKQDWILGYLAKISGIEEKFFSFHSNGNGSVNKRFSPGETLFMLMQKAGKVKTKQIYSFTGNTSEATSFLPGRNIVHCLVATNGGAGTVGIQLSAREGVIDPWVYFGYSTNASPSMSQHWVNQICTNIFSRGVTNGTMPPNGVTVYYTPLD